MSTSAALYKRFVDVCLKWPLDPTKSGRDFGAVLRQKMTQMFPQGEISNVKNAEQIIAYLKPLEIITSNTHFKASTQLFKRSSASGFEAPICRQLISTQAIREIEAEANLKSTLSIKHLIERIKPGSSATKE